MNQKNGSICSFLAYPIQGKLDLLIQELNLIKGCDLVLSQNRDVVIVVTEAEDSDSEQTVRKNIENCSSLQCLAMVFGADYSVAKGA